jgi:hypothetical protein
VCDVAGDLHPRSIKILPTACFSGARIETMTFESDSPLSGIGCRCFEGCMLLTSNCIPHRVATLGAKCFSGVGTREMTFEHESQ